MRTGSAWVVCCAVAVGACAAAPEASAPALFNEIVVDDGWLDDVVIEWERPQCFAYSTHDDAYACVDFAFALDENEGYDAREEHKAFEMLASPATSMILEHKSPGTGPQVEERNFTRAVRAVYDAGYDAPVDGGVELGLSWTPVRGGWLLFSTYLGGGHNDREYGVGLLQLSCTDPALDPNPPAIVLRDNNAERAVLFAAEGARRIAIGMLQYTSTPSWHRRSIDNIQVDVVARCGRGA